MFFRLMFFNQLQLQLYEILLNITFSMPLNFVYSVNEISGYIEHIKDAIIHF